MGEDLSTGAKIGIILIILVALIGIVFALLTMMKNITNSGSNQLQNSLDQMSSSAISDYDQKKVSGTQVITAIKMFETQDLAIVVRPLMVESDKDPKPLGGYCYNALLVGYKNTEVGATSSYGDCYVSGTDVDYITLAKKDNEGNLTDKAPEEGIALSKQKTYYLGTLAVINGTSEIAFNMNMRPLSASGNSSYVRDNATYRSYLIKDNSGTVIGICFTEMKKQ